MRREIRPMLRLAVPLVLAEIGWMAMGIVDTMMVGRLPDSAVAIGAVSLATVLFYTIAMCEARFFLDWIPSYRSGMERVISTGAIGRCGARCGFAPRLRLCWY